MESLSAEALLKRPLYLYDLPEEVLASLSLEQGDDASELAEPESPRNPNPPNVPGAQACSMCGVLFSSVPDQKSHLRSDIHHYNLKLKLRGQDPVTEPEFETLVGDLDESLSGSDSSDSEDEGDGRTQDSTLVALLRRQAAVSGKQGPDQENGDAGEKPGVRRRSPMVWMSSPVLPPNHCFTFYRAILAPEEHADQGGGSNPADVLRRKQLVPVAAPARAGQDVNPAPGPQAGPHFFMCMIGGGHFAAMLVSLVPKKGTSKGPMSREATVLAHKTFHRYTTRRKQGGAQSANDNAKGTAHSAGSSLRRYNELALTEDVRALLADWKGLVDSAQLLFVRATGSAGKRTLFGPYDGQVLRANDPRIRGFPFNTRRATQSELMRSFIELTRLKVREVRPEPARDAARDAAPAAAAVSTAAQTPKAKPKPSEEEETALLHTAQIQAFVRRSRLPALLSYLAANSLGADFPFYPPDQNHHASTPLHLASTQNSAPLVRGLLVRAGADPAVANGDGRTPFELAGDAPTRDAFRTARAELGDARWDWDAAKVPAALGVEEAARRQEDREREKGKEDAREKARRKAEEERLRAQGGGAKTAKARGLVQAEMVKRSAQERLETETRGMTPEMRARLERERRARAAEERIRRMQGRS